MLPPCGRNENPPSSSRENPNQAPPHLEFWAPATPNCVARWPDARAGCLLLCNSIYSCVELGQCMPAGVAGQVTSFAPAPTLGGTVRLRLLRRSLRGRPALVRAQTTLGARMTSPEERTDVPGVSRELADNVELVHFPEEEDRHHVPLTELATMLSGSRQHEEGLEENLSANFSQESEVLLPDAARATLPEHQRCAREGAVKCILGERGPRTRLG